jgi:hypothetical protein
VLTQRGRQPGDDLLLDLIEKELRDCEDLALVDTLDLCTAYERPPKDFVLKVTLPLTE